MNVETAIQAPRGSRLRCQGWHQEAALRMLHNNLDPEVAEKPDELVVYGGTGAAGTRNTAADGGMKAHRGDAERRRPRRRLFSLNLRSSASPR